MPKSLDYIKKISALEYLIMFFFLCISGNPLFIYTESKLLYIASAVIMFILCLMKGKKLYNQKYIFWVICSCMLFVFQNIVLEFTSINADVNFLARLYIAFLMASFFGNRFREVYFKVMVALCAISLPFYLLQIAGITPGISFDRYNSLIFFNSIKSNSLVPNDRNSGMFWEPGAFQGFIMLVPLLYSDKLDCLWRNKRKACFILILALLSTKSTAGYLTLVVFVMLRLFVENKFSFSYKVALLSFLAIIMFYFIWQLDFIGEKFISQLEDAKNIQEGDVSWDRMGAMRVDIYNIARHPFIGNGFLQESKYGILAEYMSGAGNGLSSATNIFGIPFMLLFFISVYRNFSRFTISHRWVMIFIIIMLLFNEAFLNYSLFWALLFIKIPLDYGKE